MAEARRLDTLAISELPDQDCCTLLTPRRAETRAKIDDLRRIEIRLDAAELAEQLAADRPGVPPRVAGPSVEQFHGVAGTEINKSAILPGSLNGSGVGSS